MTTTTMMMTTRQRRVGSKGASFLLVVTLLLAPGPFSFFPPGGGGVDSVLVVEARRGKVAKPPNKPVDPRSGHHPGGAASQAVGGTAIGAGADDEDTANATMLPANFTDRLAHRMAELEREKEEAKGPSTWNRITKIFKGKQDNRPPCPPPAPKPVRYYSNGTDDEVEAAPEVTLDDMEAEEAAFLDCKGGTAGKSWASRTISSITKTKPAKKIISWWSGRPEYDADYDNDQGGGGSGGGGVKDPDEVTGLGIDGDEKKMTREELDLVYAAEKERYRATENHPLLAAATEKYAYTHQPPPAPPAREKMEISLEDEQIIAGVLKDSRQRNATELMLEEAALRLATAHEARAKKNAGHVDNTKMTMIGVFLAVFGLYVYRARYGTGAGAAGAAGQIAKHRLDHLRGTPTARMQQWGFNVSGGGGGGGGGGGVGAGRFAKGAPMFKPQFTQPGQAGRSGTWTQNHGSKFKSAME